VGIYKIPLNELKEDCIVFIGELQGDITLSQLLKAIKRAWWHYEYYSKNKKASSQERRGR
jgi:hypothetical protein